MPDLDRFPETMNPFRGVKDYCPNCGHPVLGMGTQCVDCQEQEWFDTISNLTMTQIMDRLDDIFEGNEKSFDFDNGMMLLTFFGNEKEVEKGRRLMVAYNAVDVRTAKDRLCIYLMSYKNELAIY